MKDLHITTLFFHCEVSLHFLLGLSSDFYDDLLMEALDLVAWPYWSISLTQTNNKYTNIEISHLIKELIIVWGLTIFSRNQHIHLKKFNYLCWINLQLKDKLFMRYLLYFLRGYLDRWIFCLIYDNLLLLSLYCILRMVSSKSCIPWSFQFSTMIF